MHLGVPPLDLHDGTIDREDLEYRLLPEELRKEIDAAWERGPDSFAGKPCIWFDQNTKLCKHYDFRPVVCATFEPGNWVCIDDRDNRDACEPQKDDRLEAAVVLAGCLLGMAIMLFDGRDCRRWTAGRG